MARTKPKKPKYMWAWIVGIVLLLALAGVFLIMATGDTEIYTVKDPLVGTFVVTFHNPFFGWFEQAAYVSNDKIYLGDEICFQELTKVWSDSCVERIEWEFQLNGKTIKTIGKDLSSPKCKGQQISYSECWKPTKIGSWQIVSYYILQNGEVSAETATESYFVVEDKPTPECVSHSYQACSGKDLYWFNSCGEQEERAQICENGCQNNQCKVPEPVCSEGQERCLGFTLEKCSGNEWQQMGAQKNKCGVVCIDNSDCSANQICNAQYTCESSITCPSGQERCSDGTCQDSCDQPNPWPWIIMFLVFAILAVAAIIFVIWKRRQ